MQRLVSLLSAFVAVAVLGLSTLVGLVSPASAAAGGAHQAAAADDAPLSVTIDDLTPSAIPKKGPVRVSGSITNVSDETWTTINLYPFMSLTPITTADALREQAATDVNAVVGPRITKPGPYETIDELAPGESVQYSFKIKHSRISADEPGVYWFGVHALGDGPNGPSGRDDVADGRARTFIPLVTKAQHSLDTALVVPIRSGVRHHPDGSIANLGQWARKLDRGGRLRSLVEFGAAAGSRPLTWLVDPAVPDAVRSLVVGNPARSLEPSVDEGAEGQDDEDGGAPDSSTSPDPDEPSDGTSAGTDGTDGSDSPDDEPSPEVTAAATAGAAWLERFHSAVEGSEVLTLPYGDVDVSGAAAHSPHTYRDAAERSGTTLDPWDLATSPAVSSPNGYLSPAAVRMIDPDTVGLVDDRMLGRSPATVSQVAGRTLVASSSAVLSGGPAPGDTHSSLAVRQRLLSEAALRLLAPSHQPLVVSLPASWNPASPTDFFQGLDVPWLHLTTVDSISHHAGRTLDLDRLVYPDAQRERELDAGDFAAATDLARSGDSLQNLLTLNDEVASTVRDEAFTDLGYSRRKRPYAAQASAIQSRAWIDARLRGVRVDAPKAVILASGSGRFSATVTNTLDQPVTVQLEAITDPPLRVAVPKGSINIAAESRTNVLLNASSSAIGIRNVTLRLTDTAGAPLGSSEDLPIRSNRVSNVIWLILGTGIALLLGAIVVRLVRRVRAARRSAGAA